MIILDIIKLRRRHRRACKPFISARPSGGDKRLLSAAEDALKAYRSIFGGGYWNEHDGHVFNRLQSEIERYRQESGL